MVRRAQSTIETRLLNVINRTMASSTSSPQRYLVRCFPTTAHRDRKGFVEGRERIVTKIEGHTNSLPASGRLVVFIYVNGLLTRQISSSVNRVHVTLPQGEGTIIRPERKHSYSCRLSLGGLISPIPMQRHMHGRRALEYPYSSTRVAVSRSRPII